VVEVFNCNNDPGAQGKPGETPAKYPNTGVPSNAPGPVPERP